MRLVRFQLLQCVLQFGVLSFQRHLELFMALQQTWKITFYFFINVYLDCSLSLLDPLKIILNGDSLMETVYGLVVLHQNSVHVAQGVVAHHVQGVRVHSELCKMFHFLLYSNAAEHHKPRIAAASSERRLW